MCIRDSSKVSTCAADDFVATCGTGAAASPDPYYGAAAWYLDLMNVEAAWASGVTGAGVRIRAALVLACRATGRSPALRDGGGLAVVLHLGVRMGRVHVHVLLLLQYGLNRSGCALLPLLKAGNLVLLLTPTLLNALIWSRAAQFSAKARQQENVHPPLLHADDLGLAEGVDAAIIDLAESGRLQGASLLANGPSAADAMEAWRNLAEPPPLTLHLCLTEGHRLAKCPDLPSGFGTLLLASLLPWQRRRIAPQLRTVLQQQISRYRQLTGLSQIRLDGHQHIHLVPLVLDAVLDLARSESITWVRTTREPLPEGLSLKLLSLIHI